MNTQQTAHPSVLAPHPLYLIISFLRGKIFFSATTQPPFRVRRVVVKSGKTRAPSRSPKSFSTKLF